MRHAQHDHAGYPDERPISAQPRERTGLADVERVTGVILAAGVGRERRLGAAESEYAGSRE